MGALRGSRLLLRVDFGLAAQVRATGMSKQGMYPFLMPRQMRSRRLKLLVLRLSACRLETPNLLWHQNGIIRVNLERSA